MKLYWKNNSQKNIEGEYWLLARFGNRHCWASNYGRIKREGIFCGTRGGGVRFYPPKVCSQYVSDRGYLKVLLAGKQRFVHRLICEAFHDKLSAEDEVNHKNGDKKNNLPGNLEWSSKSNNVQHSYDKLNRKAAKWMRETGSNNIKAKAIIQYSLNGDKIKDWGSLTEAAISLNTTKHNISDCLRGKSKTAKNFIWRYNK